MRGRVETPQLPDGGFDKRTGLICFVLQVGSSVGCQTSATTRNNHGALRSSSHGSSRASIIVQDESCNAWWDWRSQRRSPRTDTADVWPGNKKADRACEVALLIDGHKPKRQSRAGDRLLHCERRVDIVGHDIIRARTEIRECQCSDFGATSAVLGDDVAVVVALTESYCPDGVLRIAVINTGVSVEAVAGRAGTVVIQHGKGDGFLVNPRINEDIVVYGAVLPGVDPHLVAMKIVTAQGSPDISIQDGAASSRNQIIVYGYVGGAIVNITSGRRVEHQGAFKV